MHKLTAFIFSFFIFSSCTKDSCMLAPNSSFFDGKYLLKEIITSTGAYAVSDSAFILFEYDRRSDRLSIDETFMNGDQIQKKQIVGIQGDCPEPNVRLIYSDNTYRDAEITDRDGWLSKIRLSGYYTKKPSDTLFVYLRYREIPSP